MKQKGMIRCVFLLLVVMVLALLPQNRVAAAEAVPQRTMDTRATGCYTYEDPVVTGSYTFWNEDFPDDPYDCAGPGEQVLWVEEDTAHDEGLPLWITVYVGYYTTKTRHVWNAELDEFFVSSCDVGGYRIRHCYCGESTTKDTIKPGHNYSYAVTSKATCEKDAVETGTCLYCGNTLKRTVANSRLGHSFTKYVSEKNATCLKDGTKKAKCDRCNVTDTKVDVGSALGHSFTKYEIEKSATCLEDGIKKAKCDRCNVTDTKVDVGSALGHSFTIYTKNDEAFVFGGTETAKCDRCEETNTKGEMCGNNLFWGVKKDGTLEITGTGEMYNYDHKSAPWEAWKGQITSVVIGSGVTSVGSNAFRELRALVSVSLPATLQSIQKNAFHDCTALRQLMLPENLRTIGNHAFYNCDGLEEVTLPDSLYSMGTDVFRGCSNLERISIGTGLSRISGNTFYLCTKLTTVTIPRSVTVIGTDAFQGCVGLKTVYYSGTPAAWDSVSVYSGNTRFTGATVSYLHVHDYTLIPPVTVAATCTEPGYTEYTCAYGETYRVYTAPLGHVLSGRETAVAPTCTTEGYTTDTCVHCGEEARYFYTAALGHDEGTLVRTQLPTCLDGGYSVYACNRCGTEVTRDKISALKHSFTEVLDVIAPSCTEEGYTRLGCSRCEETTTGRYVSGLGHDYVNGVVLQEETCMEYGIRGNRCNRCGKEVETGTIEPTGHKAVLIAEKDPTCTEAGNTVGTCCERCGLIFIQPTSFPALGHSFTNYISNNDATIYADGTKTAKCDRCDATDTVTDEGTILTPREGWYWIDGKLRYFVDGEACTNTWIRDTDGWRRLDENGCAVFSQWVSDSGKFYYCDDEGYRVTSSMVLDGHIYPFDEKGVLTEIFTIRFLDRQGKVLNKKTYKYGDTVTAPKKPGNQTEGDYIYIFSHWSPEVTVATQNADYKAEYMAVLAGSSAITKHPQAIRTDSGETVEFTVETAGMPISYKWQYRKIYKWFDTNMEGFDTDTLTVSAVGSRNGYDYRCVITFADGTVLISEAAELTVYTQITNVRSSGSRTALPGDRVRFTASAEGEGIHYQWQYQRPGSSLWFDTTMEGATKSTVFIEATIGRDGYRYRCKITDVTGNVVYTSAATLHVLQITYVINQVGDFTFLTLNLSGIGDYIYRWEYDKGYGWYSTEMEGHDTQTLKVKTSKLRAGYAYRCVLICEDGSRLSSREISRDDL